MTEPNHNGYQKGILISVTVIGCIGLVGIIAILFREEHPDHAGIFAGVIGGIVTTVIGFVMLLSGQKKLIINTNSKMDRLIEATSAIAYSDGKAAGAELIKAAEKLAYAAGKLAGEKSVSSQKDHE